MSRASRVIETRSLRIELHPVSLVYRDGSRGVLLIIHNFYNQSILVEANERVFSASPGFSYFSTRTRDGSVIVKINGETYRVKLDLPEPKRFEIYLTPTIHTDLGYTDPQDIVERIHRENLEKIIDALRSTGTKYVLEVLWQIRDHLEEVVELNRRGLLGIQALPMNLLTGLLSHEEVVRIFYSMRDLRRRGASISVAAVNDIPSSVWILPTILSSIGVRYFIQAINPDRAPICIINRDLQTPVEWVGPDGSSVIAWFSGCYKGLMPGLHGYHQGQWIGLLDSVERAESGLALFVWYYESRGYPFSKLLMYGLLADNRRYNDKYIEIVNKLNDLLETPVIKISTTDEFFIDLEKEIRSRGISIPRIMGSLGTYWEDGAASTARELALSRRIKKLLFFAEASYAVDYLSGGSYPEKEFDEVWSDLVLFDEHTWGAWNSVWSPSDPSVIKQWEIKSSYVKRALSRISLLTHGEYLSNPYPYEVEGLFNNTLVRLGPMSSKIIDYKVLWDAEQKRIIETDYYEIEFEKGSVIDVRDKDLGRSILSKSDLGFAEVIHVLGGGGSKMERTILDYAYLREPPEPVYRIYRETWSRIVSVRENDDLVEVKSIGRSGEIFFERVIRAPKRRKEINVIMRLEKPEIYEKEGVYIAFSFSRPSSILLEEPGVFTDYTRDYVKGACREWYTINNIVLLKGDLDIAFYSEDAPLVTINDIFRGAWRSEPEPLNGTLFSYVMNNYWHTNYKASQGGLFEFEYNLTSGKSIKPSHAIRFFSKPFRGRRINGDISIEPAEVAVTTIKKWSLGDGLVIRFLEVDNEPKSIKIRSSMLRDYKIYETDLLEEPIEDLGRFDGEIEIRFRPRIYKTILFTKK